MSDLTAEQWRKRFSILASEFVALHTRNTELEATITEMEAYLLRTDNMNTFEVLNSLYLRVDELKKDRGIDGVFNRNSAALKQEKTDE